MANEIRFDDGAGYERYMGVWSQKLGTNFLQWLAPQPGLRWLDVGCGNGAFTELIAERCAPKSVHGIDPSEAQLAYARTRPALRQAVFQQGDAMALPFEDNSFEAAVMPLVIFFVPKPEQGVAEMTRVVAPGGLVTAYGWDLLAGGFPYAPLQDEIRALGYEVPLPPNPGAAQIDALQNLWSGAGLESIETCELTVERTFEGFDDYWATVLCAPSAAKQLGGMTASEIDTLQARLRARMPEDPSGRITLTGKANAVKGRVR